MVKSARGKEINITALRTANQYSTAVGNAKMNARGDILGKNGKIIKKREEIVNEYNTKVKNAVKNVPISQDITKSSRPVQKPQTVETAEQKKNRKTPKSE